MRILMVTSFLPDPDARSAGGIVMHGTYRALAARHDVTLATFAGPCPADRQGLSRLRAPGAAVHAVWRSRPAGWRRLRHRFGRALAWIRGDTPLRNILFREGEMQRLLDRLLGEREFDLLQVEDNAMGGYRFRPGIPAVLTEHEVRIARGRWKRHQVAVWRRFERVQVFTGRDAAAARELAPDLAERFRINAFGVELPPPADPEREEADSVVFVGGFLHSPNVDAALWLGREILPRLRARRPSVRLLVVGSDPPRCVRALADTGTTVTGRVADVAPFLERAAVVVAPLRSGGGMRLKVLQAMALAKPVVTTPLGAEGIHTETGGLALAIGTDADSIADLAAALLASPQARRELGARARSVVREHHGWDDHARRLEAIYAELESPRAGRPVRPAAV